MNRTPETPAEEGLRFFGAIAASASHDMKNVLAVINEISGLFEDIPMMMAKGRPIDPERLKSLTGRMSAQIRRGDEIARNLNRFAHSIDQARCRTDLVEIVQFTLSLARRMCHNRNVQIEYSAPTAVQLRTDPFFLENLVWSCLDHATAAAGNGNLVNVLVEKRESGAAIRFSATEKGGQPGEAFPSESTRLLLGVLNADLVEDPKTGELVVSFCDLP